MTPRRVAFMGSPAIAVATLEALAREFTVPLVVTQPNRPSGRGRKVTPTAVHQKADEMAIPVLAAEDVNAPDCIARLDSIRPDAIVVVSFGQILKAKALNMAQHGCINVHFSLLPQLRGAAPVAWAIMRGFAQTGVSVMRMVRRMDAGPVFAQAPEMIRSDDTTATLSSRMGVLGAQLVCDVLVGPFSGQSQAREQDETAATYAPKIVRENSAVDWTKDAEDIDRLIRGLSGQLEAYAFLDGPKPTRVTLHNSAVAACGTPGEGVAARGPKEELIVGGSRGAVEIKEIQAEGRKKVSGRDFANGYHIRGGERFLNG